MWLLNSVGHWSKIAKVKATGFSTLEAKFLLGLNKRELRIITLFTGLSITSRRCPVWALQAA